MYSSHFMYELTNIYKEGKKKKIVIDPKPARQCLRLANVHQRNINFKKETRNRPE